MATPKPRKIIHTDDDLRTGSDYLEYHIRMFVETLLRLRDSITIGVRNDILWNAMLEDYLVHARLLINFIYEPDDGSRVDDLLAVDYFHDSPNFFQPCSDAFLKDCAHKIGGNLVHITRKPMPALKSQQSWPIDEIAIRLVPVLNNFLGAAPETRLVYNARTDCIDHLAKLAQPQVPLSAAANT